jgi:hypothetical protein
MLFKEIVAVCIKNHKKTINTMNTNFRFTNNLKQPSYKSDLKDC